MAVMAEAFEPGPLVPLAPVVSIAPEVVTEVERPGSPTDVVTRDLLARASRSQPGEAESLQFRALHLNLSVVGETAERMGLSPDQRIAVEHHALEGLHQAVRRYNPYADGDFSAYAEELVEHEIRAHLPQATLRTAVRRVALAIARA